MKQDITIENLYDLSHTIAAPLLESLTWPWEALPLIEGFIRHMGPLLPQEEFDHPQEDVWIARDAHVYPSACIHGPAIICSGAEIRHCAFIRGKAIVGRDCVVGNSTELKNVILFDNVQVPHYNYIGDSILGFHAHMGAGSITSNVKSDKRLVVVHDPEGEIETGLKKFGAMIGDNTEVGCNSVLNPGTVLGRNCIVYPTTSVRGCIPEKHIVKAPGVICARDDRN